MHQWLHPEIIISIQNVGFIITSNVLSSTLARQLTELYRIAVIFRGSNFSRIAVLEEFVEKISRMGVAQFATPIIR